MAHSSTHIADKLLSAGVITKEKYQEALNHFSNKGEYLEESLIETGALDEETLLKQLSHIYRTRYVSTEKLKRAEIPANILKMIPAQLASQLNIFPIMYDKKLGELSIVNARPSDVKIEEQVLKVANVPRMRSFMARPAAIRAAVAKFYRGDIHAFATIDKESFQAYHNMLDIYERRLIDEESMTVSLAKVDSQRERMISAEDMQRGAKRADGSVAAQESSYKTMIEIMRVMVSLLESGRGELAGHSVQTAHFTERMCRRIGLSERETGAITMAALLHDLGKGSPYHLTPFNVAEWDGHRTAAEKRFENPLRLFQSVGLPDSTLAALKHMYERIDGMGLPEGLKDKDIPLSARILAMADTFADLVANPRNPYRRTLKTEEAMEVLDKGKKKIFDPNLVDLFKIVVAGDDIKRQLLTGAQSILIVDSDPEQCAILDLQLTSRGFRVRTARTSDTAIKALGEVIPNIIISEVDLEPEDGFKLKERINSDKQAREIPFIYFTARSSGADIEKGFNLGALDYLTKPLSVDVVSAKINKIVAEKPGHGADGASGSLAEMSLPDLVQILAHGRKSGQLKLTMGQHRGEIYFVDGEIYNAMFDKLRGEEAFFQMLKFREGNFVLNPSYRAESRLINMTAEMLLLEGMRRFDEDNR
jgi:response regulator RpfG family c-di-GMP phosphodiesterase